MYVRHLCRCHISLLPTDRQGLNNHLVHLINLHCHIINTATWPGRLPWIFHLNGLSFHFLCLTSVGMKKTRDKELWLPTILQLLPSPTQIDPHLVGCCEHKHIRLSRKGLCIHMRAFFSPSIWHGSQHIIYLLEAMNEVGSKRRCFIMFFSSI